VSGLREELTDFSQAIVNDAELSPLIEQNYPHYNSTTALEIYRNNYRGNLYDALAAEYPVTVQIVGEEFFHYMANQYITLHPSHSGNLHHYGTEFAAFVANFDPAQELIYLADVVRLECAYQSAYFADDTTIMDLANLAYIAPHQYAELVLRLHPATCLLHSTYPISAIWQAHQPGANKDFKIDLDSGPCDVLVSRNNGIVTVTELSSAETNWLQAIQHGDPLGEACTSTLSRYPDFDLQDTLLHLATRGALSDFSLREKQ